MATEPKPKLDPKDVPSYIPRWVLWVGIAVAVPVHGWVLDLERDQIRKEEEIRILNKELEEIQQFLADRMQFEPSPTDNSIQ